MTNSKEVEEIKLEGQPNASSLESALIQLLNKEITFNFSPKLYTPELIQEVMTLHRQAKDKTGQTYLDIEKKDGEPLFEREIMPHVKIVIAEAKNMMPSILTALTQEQMTGYVEKDTMGKFPKKIETQEDEQAWQELTELFIATKADDVWTYAVYETDEGFLPFAGARVVFGKNEKNLSKTNGQPDALPTLAALKIQEDLFEKSKLGQIPEKNTVCLTRFFAKREKLPKENFSADELLQLKKISLFIVAYLSIAVDLADKDITQAFVDTHEEKIWQMLKNFFAGDLIANANQLKPTKLVLNNILKCHYKFYQNQLMVINMPQDEFLSASKNLLQKNNLPI